MPKKSINESKVTVEELYQKMTPHEHILELPDTYIGSVAMDTFNMRVYDEKSDKIVLRDIKLVPGFYKIFDEILVNAIDHCVRDKKCKTIKVNIDQKNNQISVWNDGNGIPVEIHKKEKIYVPEMIFGHLLTSGNYREKGKIVGGKNGYGAKLCNIYSKNFWIETVCSVNKKKFVQHFSDNMYKKDPPKISDVSKSTPPYTKITFEPDLARFDMKILDDDIVSLLKKRVYDCAGCTDQRISVYLNDTKLPINGMEEYIKMFISDSESENDQSSKPIYQKFNDRWEVAVVYDPSAGFNQISYVNGICTYHGGTHTKYVTDRIVEGILKLIKEKHKDLRIRNSQIKDNLTIFIRCTIEDPSFNSQVKEFMTTKVVDWGSKCEIDEEFIKKVSKTGIMDTVIDFARLKELSEMKKTDGKKRTNLSGIKKLEDAMWAGGRNSCKATLILTEGDSAKPFAMVAREIVGHDMIGVFPLKGKLLNVREATVKQLKTNEEIANIKQIMGLKQGVRYKDTKDLRYGKILILTDSDVDGTHIKGLVMNMFHYFWPSLLKIDGFLQSYATPIVQAFKKNDKAGKFTKKFYTLPEYEAWSKKIEAKNYSTRYYKGLGTSTEKDAKDAFDNFDQNVIDYIWDKNSTRIVKKIDSESDSTTDDDATDMNDKSNKAINLAFAKPLANKRKEWLRQYDREKIIDNSVKKVPITRFINEDLIHFSNYSVYRAIPGIDGFKPSHRKILYGSFKRNLLKDDAIKVSQLAGFISDVAQYHHGEVSLQGTIINMAQDFVGTNNINLLIPEGNFGTRLLGGKDASSARYIFTKLSTIVSYIFREEDKYVLKHIVEDGSNVEPELYPTIIPMVLINGAEGIGTGFSTFIPPFNPLDVVANIKRLLHNKDTRPMTPWFRGYTGTIVKKTDDTYETEGCYEIIDENTLRITELPIKTWTEDYKEFLESVISEDSRRATDKQFVSSYVSKNTNTKVNFVVEFCRNVLQDTLRNNSLTKKKDTLPIKMKLTNNIKLTNMHLYNAEGVITKYLSVDDILRDFFKYRYTMYEKRKEHRVRHLENAMLLCFYRRKYIQMVMDKVIIVERKKVQEVLDQLVKHKFPKLNRDVDAPEHEKSYSYIESLKIFHLTEEKLAELDSEYEKEKKTLDDYKKLTIEELWETELDEFVAKYKIWNTETDPHQLNETDNKKKKTNVKTRKRAIRVVV